MCTWQGALGRVFTLRHVVGLVVYAVCSLGVRSARIAWRNHSPVDVVDPQRLLKLQQKVRTMGLPLTADDAPGRTLFNVPVRFFLGRGVVPPE